VNELVMNDMEKAREYVNVGLMLRAKAQLKVRQPLASVTVPSLGTAFDFAPILLEELNVKTVLEGAEVAIDERITPELKREGLMREIIRHVQAARKNAGLNVDDRIRLYLQTKDDELATAVNEYVGILEAETLATLGEADGHREDVKVEGKELTIILGKV
jgi:isoleucyl-tRNA synthetase